MAALRGIGITFGIFAASFALHIVGGATDQGWLFALAVALIYLSATGFPAIAIAVGGFRDVATAQARATATVGAVAGFGFTLGALWATNGRAFAWWEFPLATLLVFVSSGVIILGWRALGGGVASGAGGAKARRALG